MARTDGGRGGKVICRRTGERWTAAVRLDERGDGQPRHFDVALARTFTTESAANRAGTDVVRSWKAGQVVLREILLRELAATYRSLRETHAPMQPASVPTTRAAWEHAIAAWEKHVQSAFDPTASTVRRHRLADGEPDAGA
jgi:hypothetical protein